MGASILGLLSLAVVVAPVGPTVGSEGSAVYSAISSAIRRQPEFPAVELPDGATLSPQALDLGRPELLFPRDTPAAVQRSSDNNVIGIYSHSNGRLEGRSAGFHPNGTLQAIVPYRNGRRHGTVALWDENGLREFIGEYKRGNQHGRTILFHKGRPWFIADVDNGVAMDCHAIGFPRGRETPYLVEVTRDERPVSDELMLWMGLTAMSDIEADLSENEPDLRRALRDWWQSVRRNAVVRLAPARRQAASERNRRRNEAAAAAMNRLQKNYNNHRPTVTRLRLP